MKSSDQMIKLFVLGLTALTLVTGCSSNPPSSKPSSTDMIGEVKADSFGDGQITPGNPSQGILPKRSDGTPRYQDVSIEYPQGKAFVEGFRQILPHLDEDEYRKGAKYPLRNAQEVCGGLQLDAPSSVKSVELRVEAQTNTDVSETQAKAIYNLAIDTVCPDYKNARQ